MGHILLARPIYLPVSARVSHRLEYGKSHAHQILEAGAKVNISLLKQGRLFFIITTRARSIFQVSHGPGIFPNKGVAFDYQVSIYHGLHLDFRILKVNCSSLKMTIFTSVILGRYISSYLSESFRELVTPPPLYRVNKRIIPKSSTPQLCSQAHIYY